MKKRRVCDRQLWLLAALSLAVFVLTFAVGRYAVRVDKTVCILLDGALRKLSRGAWGLAQFWTDTEATIVLNVRLPRILAAAVLLAYLISRKSRLEEALSMVLAGMMISSLFTAGTSFIKLVADTDNQLPAITYWLMGSLTSVRAQDVRFAALPILIGLIPLLLLRWRINLLTLSDAEARSMGVDTRRLRLVVIVCATLMTAASVAISGMIGWVGLVIPHFCRILFGYDYRRLLPGCVMLGASFLMLVDTLARTLTTSEIPLGILTSFVGAPVFLYLILKGGADRAD